MNTQKEMSLPADPNKLQFNVQSIDSLIEEYLLTLGDDAGEAKAEIAAFITWLKAQAVDHVVI